MPGKPSVTSAVWWWEVVDWERLEGQLDARCGSALIAGCGGESERRVGSMGSRESGWWRWPLFSRMRFLFFIFAI